MNESSSDTSAWVDIRPQKMKDRMPSTLAELSASFLNVLHLWETSLSSVLSSGIEELPEDIMVIPETEPTIGIRIGSTRADSLWFYRIRASLWENIIQVMALSLTIWLMSPTAIIPALGLIRTQVSNLKHIDSPDAIMAYRALVQARATELAAGRIDSKSGISFETILKRNEGVNAKRLKYGLSHLKGQGIVEISTSVNQLNEFAPENQWREVW